MVRNAVVLLGVLASFAGCAARHGPGASMAAAGPETALAPPPTRWGDFDVYDVRQDAPAGDWVRWRTQANESGDARIELERVVRGRKESGTLLLVAGHVLAVRDLQIAPGNEIDELDSSVLASQLVLSALARAFPDGPGLIRGSAHIDRVESQEALRVGTLSAGGALETPWRMTGTLKRDSASRLEFDLTLAAKNVSEPLRYSGTLATAGTKLLVPDGQSLEGWKLHSLGPRVQTRDGATLLDYGTTPREGRALTVGEVRKALAAEDAPQGARSDAPAPSQE